MDKPELLVQAAKVDCLKKGSCQVSFSKEDFRKHPSELLINAANRKLVHGSGIAFDISTAAGPALAAECDAFVLKNPETLRVGYNYLSKSYNLKSFPRGILHVVGPSSGTLEQYFTKLMAAYSRAFVFAAKLKVSTITTPLLSSGVFSNNKDVPLISAQALLAAAEEVKFVGKIRVVGSDLTGPLSSLIGLGEWNPFVESIKKKDPQPKTEAQKVVPKT